jgi:hypothetical protein
MVGEDSRGWEGSILPDDLMAAQTPPPTSEYTVKGSTAASLNRMGMDNSVLKLAPGVGFEPTGPVRDTGCLPV